MMKRTGSLHFETYDKALEKASDLRKSAPGKSGKDWKVKIVRRGSVRSQDNKGYDVVSYVSVPDKDKKDGDKDKKDKEVSV